MGKEEENNDCAMPRRDSETKFITIFARKEGSKNIERKTRIDNLVPESTKHDFSEVKQNNFSCRILALFQLQQKWL